MNGKAGENITYSNGLPTADFQIEKGDAGSKNTGEKAEDKGYQVIDNQSRPMIGIDDESGKKNHDKLDKRGNQRSSYRSAVFSEKLFFCHTF